MYKSRPNGRDSCERGAAARVLQLARQRERTCSEAKPSVSYFFRAGTGGGGGGVPGVFNE
jgi:hypothetical protein